MATDNQFEKTRVRLTDLLSASEFKTLTGPQRSFLLEYIAGGLANGRYSATDACRVAYPRVKATAVWASRLLQNRRIKKVIALHLGLTEVEVVLADVRALIKKAKRKNARLDLLVPYWIRTVDALEAIAAKGNTLDLKTTD